MLFDSADYYFPDFQSGLAKEAAATHIGMYVAWLTMRGLGSVELNGYVDDLRARRIRCADLLLDACDGKFAPTDVNAEGLAFSQHYFTRQYEIDYRSVLGDQFRRTGHALDDFCSVPGHWHNFDRMAMVLNRRWMDWRAERDKQGEAQSPALSPPDSVLGLVVHALIGFLDEEGLVHDRVNEPLMMDEPTPDRAGRLFRVDFEGGRHWLLVVVRRLPQGAFAITLTVASCLDRVAERIRDHGLPEYFQDTPDDPLPYTALVRLYQWLRADTELIVEADDDYNSRLVFRTPEAMRAGLPVLAQRCRTVLGPLLKKLGTVQGLDELRCTSPISESILYTDPFNRLVLSTAEVARNPRILSLCDELEALGRDPQAPGPRMFGAGLMAHINLVRSRHGG
ncbi:hypothetical protein J2W49_003434 [Hydrogenophaga palleronii]|uniref:DUF7832 domain-containing protein n=1 Tax=Hydrogenophaga palleronii TaxID=65655 RepID=A0ABU1WQ77_9BURK|nr:hypothetical protein [Hydrogenophaga palleronii]MDR7151458.1 hypothetical protein [Hydrogenophaga palleronii]